MFEGVEEVEECVILCTRFLHFLIEIIYRFV